jgi:phytoene dehydrogenase-like protein
MTRANVIADALYTPFDIEREMGMVEGDFGHGRPKGTAYMDLQRISDRVVGYSRTGTEGLYVCAGNGVSAGPGYAAFKAIAEDFELPEIWKRDDRTY